VMLDRTVDWKLEGLGRVRQNPRAEKRVLRKKLNPTREKGMG